MTPIRFAAKVDANQHEIVRALRSAGATVQSLAAVGAGVPDLLVGHGGRNLLMEVKDMSSSRKDKLTPGQEVWHGDWRGQKAVVRNANEALCVLSQAVPGSRSHG